MGVIGPRWTCPYCGTHYVYKSSAIVCYESKCFSQEGEKDETFEEKLERAYLESKEKNE